MTTSLKENAPDLQTEAHGRTHQYVTFLVENEVFAAGMEEVQEIIRVPAMVHVPLAPPALQGLANLRGKILPIFSLRSLFGLEKTKNEETTRAIVVEAGQPIGFVVDRVSNVIHVESAQIEDVIGIQENIDKEVLNGVIKNVAGFPMVMILDFHKIVQREFSFISSARDTQKEKNLTAALRLKKETVNQETKKEEEIQLVSFSIAQQEYAIDISYVKEIVQIPSKIVRLPNAPLYLSGFMNLRNTLIPLINVRKVFELEEDQRGIERKRVVLISTEVASIGLVVDSVSEVVRISKNEMEPMPAIFSTEGKMSDIGYICRLEGGNRLISILLVDQFMKNCKVKETLKNAEELEMKIPESARDQDKDTSSEEEKQMVIFRLADCEFGVPIESVQEIVRIPEELAHIPKAPDFVEGVINLRGTILPIIDLRKRLSFSSIHRNDRQRIIVFFIDGIRTGFIVDAVLEVLKIPTKCIEPAPQISGEQAKLLNFVANLESEKRIIQLLEPKYLLEEADKTRLTEINDENKTTDR